jgi:polar amino acid transport system substrate-binding protein
MHRALAILCLSAAAAHAQPPVLRWGGDAEGGAPFVEADPANPSVVRGFDVEVAAMLARGLGRTPRFVQVAWANIPQSVERGDFKVGLSGIEDRPELRARHALSIPYYEFEEVLAVRPADSRRFRRLADLAGRRVGTLGGTMAYEILVAEQGRSGLVPVSYDDDVHPYEDLAAGRLDAVLLDDVLAARSLRRVGGYVIQPEPVASGAYVAVFARRDSLLRDSANAVLRERMRDGSLERTFRAWGVWTDAQARHFERVLADSALGPRPSSAPPSSRSSSPCSRWRSPSRWARRSRRGGCTAGRSRARCSRRTWSSCAARRCCSSSS